MNVDQGVNLIAMRAPVLKVVATQGEELVDTPSKGLSPEHLPSVFAEQSQVSVEPASNGLD